MRTLARRLAKLEQAHGVDDLRLLSDDALDTRIARCCERLGLPVPTFPMTGPDIDAMLRDAARGLPDPMA